MCSPGKHERLFVLIAGVIDAEGFKEYGFSFLPEAHKCRFLFFLRRSSLESANL